MTRLAELMGSSHTGELTPMLAERICNLLASAGFEREGIWESLAVRAEIFVPNITQEMLKCLLWVKLPLSKELIFGVKWAF